MDESAKCAACGRELGYCRHLLCKACRTKPCVDCRRPLTNGKRRCPDCTRKRTDLENDGPGLSHRLGSLFREP